MHQNPQKAARPLLLSHPFRSQGGKSKKEAQELSRCQLALCCCPGPHGLASTCGTLEVKMGFYFLYPGRREEMRHAAGASQEEGDP